ncbi:MAG: hypothetical protein ACP5IZ_10810, partial [Thermoprotei archaeon]
MTNNTPKEAHASSTHSESEWAKNVKILADIKKELEERKEELQKEIERTKILLSLIEIALEEQSFIPA